MKIPDEILLKVLKPSRYIGNEVNVVTKNINDVDVRFVLCFPDIYEIAMSHLGLQILYFFLNRRADTYCERSFSVWDDMEEEMIKNGIPQFSLETVTPLLEFDFIGFTLQYEMSFTNLVNMLSLSNIPIFSKDRGEECPIICAGGPCAYNPEPLADIVDFFYIGEGEVCLDEILDLYKGNKASGGSRDEFLLKILSIQGVYVPKFYDVNYNIDGTIESFSSNNRMAKDKIQKTIVNNLDNVFYPETQLVPLIEVIHDRVTLEVFRGCIRGCRFCQAGYVYRPVREKSTETLIDNCSSLIENTGHDEISLVSLSTGDYTNFENLAEKLIDIYSEDKINLSLPSLRIDSINLELMKKVQSVRRSSLTFAPEAGTQRLRDVINKGITEDEILSGCSMAFENGWNRVKLYFMIGLPTETYEDLNGIAELSEKIVKAYYAIPTNKRQVSIVMSTACFVPKPFTPFQWEAQNVGEIFEEKQKFVKSSIKRKQINFNYHSPKQALIEGAIARGDRRVGQAIVNAWKKGARFDSWNDRFNYNLWQEAFVEAGISVEFYANRVRSENEILPWDHIDIGVTKEFLWKEKQNAYKGSVTKNCRAECANCGAAVFKGGVCVGK